MHRKREEAFLWWYVKKTKCGGMGKKIIWWGEIYEDRRVESIRLIPPPAAMTDNDEASYAGGLSKQTLTNAAFNGPRYYSRPITLLSIDTRHW